MNSVLIKILACFSFLSSGLLWASPHASYYGVVKDVQGIAFVKSGDKTRELKKGMRLFDHSEIMTTAGSQVTFMNRYDHIFHVSNSSHVSVFNQIVTLKRGYVWFQSLRRTNESFALESANAQLIYQGGEGIFSFDDFNGRTQFLSLNGTFLFGNPLHEMHVEQLRQGEFSFVDNEVADARPRRATMIGQESYQRVTGLFYGVSPLSGEIQFPEMNTDRAVASTPRAQRGIASIGSSFDERPVPTVSIDHSKLREYYSSQLKVETSQKPKELSPEASKRAPASVSQSDRSFRPNYSRKSGVPVRVYRVSSEDNDLKKKVTSSQQRNPSSTKAKTEARKPASLSPVQIDDPFEQGLSDHYSRQQRHSEEVRALIQDLQTYERDFKVSY